MTAINAPSGNSATTWRSPLSTRSSKSPIGRPAEPQSIRQPMTLRLAHPLLHGDRGPSSQRAVQLELVHQAPGAEEAHAQALTGGVPGAHGKVRVLDARSFIDRHDHQSTPAIELDRAQDHLAMLGVFDDVARDFRDGGGNEV